MARVLAYHRPANVQEALSLLSAPSAYPLSGGVDLVARLNLGELADITVVDLQDLALQGIRVDRDRVVIGAAVTLQALADSESVPEVLRTLARAESPSTLRSKATVGGAVAGAHGESALVAGLLAWDGEVTLASTGGEQIVKLERLLADGLAQGTLILSLSVAASGQAAVASTGRTPADTPIVAAVARRRADGSTVLALSGVATTPVVADPTQPAQGLEPPGDFRGTAEYRGHLACLLSKRAMHALEQMEAGK